MKELTEEQKAKGKQIADDASEGFDSIQDACHPPDEVQTVEHVESVVKALDEMTRLMQSTHARFKSLLDEVRG